MNLENVKYRGGGEVGNVMDQHLFPIFDIHPISEKSARTNTDVYTTLGAVLTVTQKAISKKLKKYMCT